jgi:hypothetical protein
MMLTILKFKECSHCPSRQNRGLFIYCFFILFIGLFSCKQKNQCEWRSASDLEQIDRATCLSHWPENDTLYARLQKFSLSYNPFRRQKGIPVLAQESECLSLCEGDVRWSGDIKNGKSISFSHPYLKWKTVRWRGDTLLEDHSFYVENSDKDRWGKTLEISYYLDTVQQRGYLFEYNYSPGNPAPDISFTRQQADSLLKLWNLTIQ